MGVKFVLLASMRTGSNLLNRNLNQYEQVVCHGEVFNPKFIGLERKHLVDLGVERSQPRIRDADPLAFLDRLIALDRGKIVGLHMFPNHHELILDQLLDDESVKKVCLRRSLFHSFVSLQIAKATNVWLVTSGGKLSEEAPPKVKVVFCVREFEDFYRTLSNFWNKVFQALRRTGQSWFPIWYRQVSDVGRVNELVRFIGGTEQKNRLAGTLAKQNPDRLEDKVENWEDLQAYARARGLEAHL